MTEGTDTIDDFEQLIFDDRKPPGSSRSSAAEPTGIVEFGAESYLTCFPDAASSIEAGHYGSALEHYDAIGKPERRLAATSYLRALAGGVQEQASHGLLSFNIDVVMVSASGIAFVVGWTDDRSSPLLSVSVIQADEGWNCRALPRCRRTDVEGLLQAPPGHSFGFWLVHKLPRFNSQRAAIMLRARFADGRFTQTEITPRIVTDVELRETILGHFAELQYFGNRDIESFQQLDTGAGAALVAMNRAISHSITAAAHVERYGPARSRFGASFIVCLFGKSEYFFLQNALFSPGRGAFDVEFIYVSNSPELTETLQKAARISERIYGMAITLVTLPGNAGFSAANNAAARFARSDRVVFINPDVFPQDDQWAITHAAILETRPREQTMLFGAPLYYDDGSLMHGGMYFEIDQGLSVGPTAIKAAGMIRVEHYGKGAPAWSDRYTRARPVPAVTGAFISADRAWFELLGGFTEDYLFGHYEDADLCLKSLQRGVPVWLQDVRFWHLEGKGSVRRPPHEGGSLVNRWIFTQTWGKLVEASLVGRSPKHPLLNGAPGRSFAPPAATTPAPVAPAAPAAPAKSRRAERVRS